LIKTVTSIIALLFLFTVVTNPFTIIHSIQYSMEQSDGIASTADNEREMIQKKVDNQRSEVNNQENSDDIVKNIDISQNNGYNYRMTGSSGSAGVVDYISRNEIINITSNQNFTETASLPSNNWPGTGTKDDPIIIENYNITRTDRPFYLIKIENVTLHFIIRNCFLKGGSRHYIEFINTSNGLIIGNHLLGDTQIFGEVGIYLDSNSGFNMVKYNDLEVFQEENGMNVYIDNDTNTFIYNYWDEYIEISDDNLDGIYDSPFNFYNEGSARFPDNYTRVYMENWNHLPIVFTSNEEFDEFISDEGWTGNGTAVNPYLIQGINITADSSTQYALYLENIDLYFELVNCTIQNGLSGAVHLTGVPNARIVNVTASGSQYVVFTCSTVQIMLK